MGLNKPFDRYFYLVNGAVKTSGGSLSLAKGQLAAVDLSKTSPAGAKVVSSFAGKPKKEKDFAIRLGVSERQANRSYANHPKSTKAFSLNEVVGLEVSAPKNTKQSVDELVIGYDGITPGSGFSFKTGDPYFQIAVEVSGDPISYLGGGTESEIVVVRVEVPDCDPFNTCVDCDNCSNVDCKSITMEAIERLRRKQLTGGTRLDEVVDITPVFSCDNDVTSTLIPYTFYTLSLCDTGTDAALAAVQANYDYKVVRTGRSGSTSTYTVMTPDTVGAPSSHVQTIGSFIKDCAACPAGYTASPSGVLYVVTLEDDGTDQSALVDNLPGYVATTIEKSGNDYGVGYYTLVLDNKLTDAEITTWMATNAISGTATVAYAGTVSSLCEPDSQPAGVAWTAGETCNATSETYEIILNDTICGETRLAELQGAYPNLTIAVAGSANSTRTVTLTGSSGTANINIGGTDYLATYATSLTVTAAAFVTSHAATILADEGVTVTSSGAVITLVGPTAVVGGTVTITNATTNLAGTVSASSVIPFRQACQTKYTTTVTTNLVCEECDPIFNDYFVSQAPGDFDIQAWVKVVDNTTQPNGNCECGIRIKAKTFHLVGEEALRDLVGFTETSTLIRASAEYPEEIREGIGRLPKGADVGRYFSRFIPRTHLGGNMLDLEREGDLYFKGTSNKDYLGRVLRGETSNIEDQLVQYVQYTLKISSTGHSQSFAGISTEDINYQFFAPVGQHYALETLLNNLAGVAGVDPVKAFGA